MKTYYEERPEMTTWIRPEDMLVPISVSPAETSEEAETLYGLTRWYDVVRVRRNRRDGAERAELFSYRGGFAREGFEAGVAPKLWRKLSDVKFVEG